MAAKKKVHPVTTGTGFSGATLNQGAAEPKQADLKKEFGPTVKSMLIGVVATRAKELADKNTWPVIFMPITDSHVAVGLEGAEAIARLERSACLDIMQRCISDKALQEVVRAAVMSERGGIAFAYTMKCEWALAE